MSSKIEKIEINIAGKAQEIATRAGFLLMATAATIGLVELPEHFNTRVVAPGMPAVMLVAEQTGEHGPQRREREETGPHYISYSVTQRTPGRSGRS